MPTVNIGDYEIYYEVKGNGIPILLLEGLGYSTWMWKFQVPEFSRRFTMIMPDNRGVGKSTRLAGAYSIDKFARDSLGVIDALELSKFYVLGVSMGGFIAQEVAAMVPDRVKGLILVSTSAGGRKSIPMSREVYDQMRQSIDGESPKDKVRRTMKLAFTESFPISKAKEFDSLIEDRMNSIQAEDQLIYQTLSSINFDRSTSNVNVKIPSLIIAGTDDRVLPWLNSLLLYKSLPRSSLILFWGQNHLLFMERSNEFNKVMADFVETVEDNNFSEFIKVVE